MARLENRQLLYVGNLGDILKHAFLFEVATALARERRDVHFIDTHAFQLHAPLEGENRARWERDVAELAARHSGYARYAALERDSLEKNRHYRCSAAVAIAALGRARRAAVLAEANAQSRVVLLDQLRAERIANVRVVEDATRVDDAELATHSLLVHVDPFRLTSELWSAIAPALSSLTARAEGAVILVYRYSRNARATWPAPLAGTSGPVLETRGGPHEIAVYASDGLGEIVGDVGARLGW